MRLPLARMIVNPMEDYTMPAQEPTNDAPIVAHIGLDWSKDHHDLCLLAADCCQRESLILEHRPEALQGWVQQLRARFPVGRVAIALEQSRGALFHCLMDYDFLVLYPVPPLSLASYRKTFHPSGAKSDPGDAELLLDLLLKHSDSLRPWLPEDPATRSLRLLVQHRRQLIGIHTRMTNQITELLKGYFPQALEWAGDLTTIQACEFLHRWPTLAKVKKAGPQSLRKFYQRHRCRHPELVEQRIQRVAQALPLTQDPAILLTSPLLVKSLASSLHALIPQITIVEHEIEKLFAAHPDHDLFSAVPGAGAVLAPRLLVAFGADRSRFESAQQVQEFSGIAPVLERSGQSLWVHQRFACSQFIKQTFHEFAASSIHFCGWARDFYDQQRAKGKKHHTAVRALAFKWIRILFRCWQNRTPYQETIYIQSLHQHNSPLIVTLCPSK